MQNFRAPSVEIVTPDGWLDNSTYVVAGPPVRGFSPNVVVTLALGVMDPYLRRHVDLQVAQMPQRLPAFRMIVHSEPFPTPYGQAVTLEYEWTSAEAGLPLHQYQMYILVGQTLYTLTATAPVLSWPELQGPLLAIVRSFRPSGWPVQPPVIPPG